MAHRAHARRELEVTEVSVSVQTPVADVGKPNDDFHPLTPLKSGIATTGLVPAHDAVPCTSMGTVLP